MKRKRKRKSGVLLKFTTIEVDRLNELKSIQLNNGLTNLELADKLGLSISLIEKWRNGNRPITESRWIAIQSIFCD